MEMSKIKKELEKKELHEKTNMTFGPLDSNENAIRHAKRTA